MKKIIITLLVAMAFTVPQGTSAASLGIPYNCEAYTHKHLAKPQKPGYITYRWRPRDDKFNNGKIELIWGDSSRAHTVEIQYRKRGKQNKWKKIYTEDNAKHWIRGLKNGQEYKFRIRGVSNCGKSSWTKVLTAKP